MSAAAWFFTGFIFAILALYGLLRLLLKAADVVEPEHGGHPVGAILLALLLLSPSAASAFSYHADFNTPGVIDSGFSTSKSGSATDNVTYEGWLQLRSPSANDAIIIRMDNTLTYSSQWVVEMKFKYASLASQYPSLINLFQREFPMVVRSSTAEPRDDRLIQSIDGGTNKWLAQYVAITTGVPGDNCFFWDNSIWSVTAAWYSGPVNDCAYIVRAESKQNSGVWQFNFSLKRARDNAVVYDTGWDNWAKVYDNNSLPLRLFTGDRYTNGHVLNIDIDYIYADGTDPIVAPGDPQNLVATAGVNLVTLTWTAPITGDPPTSYKVYRSTDSGATWSSVLATLDNTTLTWTDKYKASSSYAGGVGSAGNIVSNLGLEKGKRYDYKVTAVNSGGASAGATANATPVAVTAASAGTYKVKHLALLIAQSTDYWSTERPVAEYQAMHDDWKDNVMKAAGHKLGVVISWDILNAGNANEIAIRGYIDNLIRDYNYDILTAPSPAWYPCNTTYSLGFAAETERIRSMHDNVVTRYGKAPVGSLTWQTCNNIADQYVTQGYRRLNPGTLNQYSLDSMSCMGYPVGPYRPSKRAISIRPSGAAGSLYDNIVASFDPITRTAFPVEVASSTTSAWKGMTTAGVADLPIDFWQATDPVKGYAAWSQIIPNQPGFLIVDYLDPAWAFNDTWAPTHIPNLVLNGQAIHENYYADRNIGIWMKDYLHTDNVAGEYVSMTELNSWSDNTTTFPSNAKGRASFAIQPWSLVGEEGTYPPVAGDNGAWYSSYAYTFSFRWHLGEGGFIRPVEYVPMYDDYDEPATVNVVWNNSTLGSHLRDNTAVLLKFAITAADTKTYTVNGKEGTDNNANVRAPSYSVSGDDVTVSFDIYALDNTTRLTTLRYACKEGAFCWYKTNVAASTTVTATGALAAAECASDPVSVRGSGRTPWMGRWPNFPNFP